MEDKKKDEKLKEVMLKVKAKIENALIKQNFFSDYKDGGKIELHFKQGGEIKRVYIGMSD